MLEERRLTAAIERPSKPLCTGIDSASINTQPIDIGSYLVPVDVMLCYVHVAYVHMRRSTLLVWHSRAPFGLDLLLSTPHFNLL
jgi:hypothetical protein